MARPLRVSVNLADLEALDNPVLLCLGWGWLIFILSAILAKPFPVCQRKTNLRREEVQRLTLRGGQWLVTAAVVLPATAPAIAWDASPSKPT